MYKEEYKFVYSRVCFNELRATQLEQTLRTKCKHKFIYDEENADSYCVYCYTLKTNDKIQEVNKDKIKQRHFQTFQWEHDRNRWTGYVLEYAVGMHNKDIENCWLGILQEVPNPFTWYDVYCVYRSYNLHDHWVGFGHIIGLPIQLSPTILHYTNKFTNEKKGKYRVSYMYLVYKFTQMFGNPYDERFVPLKGKLTWIVKMDEWWKTICQKEWFEFKPTKIYHLKWSKTHIVSQLEKI